jgi:hypothetical protein
MIEVIQRDLLAISSMRCKFLESGKNPSKQKGCGHRGLENMKSPMRFASSTPNIQDAQLFSLSAGLEFRPPSAV